ncbi:hypothetical protein [Leptospirillum ferrooxidans]|nr:hypothetical protein [Leptospirillum ferrooxidans]
MASFILVLSPPKERIETFVRWPVQKLDSPLGGIGRATISGLRERIP